MGLRAHTKYLFGKKDINRVKGFDLEKGGMAR